MKEIKEPSKVIIYGDSDFAEQVYYQLESDGRYQVVAFTVDEARLDKTSFKGLPVIEFQKLKEHYSLEDVALFPAIGYSKLNKIRELVMSEIKQSGFQLFTYISKNAVISSQVSIGEGVYICEFVSIGANAKIGQSVLILPNSSIAHNVVISDYSYVSQSTTIGGNVTVKSYSFLGLGCTIKNSITIEEYNIIGSAANVIKSTTPNGVYIGNPAKRLKDVDLLNIKI